MGPSFKGEIGLGVEAHTEDDDGEKAGDVAREFPILPFTGLSRRLWKTVEQVSVGPLLVTWSSKWVRPVSSSGSEARTNTGS